MVSAQSFQKFVDSYDVKKMRQNPCFEVVAGLKGCTVASFFWLGWADGVCMSLGPSIVFGSFASGGLLRSVGGRSGGAFGDVWALVGLSFVVLGPSRLEDGCYSAPFFVPVTT